MAVATATHYALSVCQDVPGLQQCCRVHWAPVYGMLHVAPVCGLLDVVHMSFGRVVQRYSRRRSNSKKAKKAMEGSPMPINIKLYVPARCVLS